MRRWIWVVLATACGAPEVPDAPAGHAPDGGALGIGPEAPRADDALIASWLTPPTDADGDEIMVRWSWTRDGVVVDTLTGPKVPRGQLRGGELWTAHAIPNDGRLDGPEVTASVRVEDTPPEAHAALSPDSPRVGLPVSCLGAGAADPDGDPITYEVRWTVNGVEAGTGAELPASAFQHLDEVSCTLLPRTALADGVPTTTSAVVQADLAPGNVLLLVIDDVGAYDVGTYGVGDDPPRTPGIDALAAEGVTFTRAWSNPLCSPSRGSIMTGRYPFRTGVGDNLRGMATGFSLPAEEVTIPQWLGDQGGYTREALGKWHLSTVSDPLGPTPLGFGFERYRGLPSNLDLLWIDGALVENDYFAWESWDDDEITRQTGYLTTSEADDAIDRMATMQGPWFLYVAFHAAHTPLHDPPGATPLAEWTGRDRYKATVEALDAEISRVVAATPPGTTLILVGDNGAPMNLPAPPYESWELKGSPMEGGIRVPLIIRSPYVTTPGARVRSLVHLVDLFPTIADIARAPVGAALELDGRTLLPFLTSPDRADSRQVVYSERFDPSPDAHKAWLWERAVRDDRYKVVRVVGYPDGCFDLGDGFREGANLLTDPAASDEAKAACAALSARLDTDDVRSR